MTSICEGADCFGISTSLDGNTCFTQEVECKDNKLVVRSQGTRLDRFGNCFAAADPVTPGPVAVVTGSTVAGPRNPALGILLDVSLTNPFCSTAAIKFNIEFGINARVSFTDYWSVNGDVSIVGGVFIEKPPPFAVGIPLPSYQINLDTNDGTSQPNNDNLVGIDRQYTYTIVGEVAALTVFSFQALTRFEAFNIRGPGRVVGGFNTAVTIDLSPKL